jgi:hypothetical protein
MNSSTTAKFRAAFASLPKDIQDRARKAYRIWKDDHRHPSIHFKKVGKVWSARIDENYRVLAHIVKGHAYWFWIGSHDEYERLIKKNAK